MARRTSLTQRRRRRTEGRRAKQPTTTLSQLQTSSRCCKFCAQSTRCALAFLPIALGLPLLSFPRWRYGQFTPTGSPPI
eukprot:1343932-Pyramimonas_sp.AAC.1